MKNSMFFGTVKGPVDKAIHREGNAHRTKVENVKSAHKNVKFRDSRQTNPEMHTSHYTPTCTEQSVSLLKLPKVLKLYKKRRTKQISAIFSCFPFVNTT